MACSKFQYVKKFQDCNTILPETYMLVRVDGRAFTKFCIAHDFEKPNDLRAIKLMNSAAEFVCQSFKDIFLAYGQSDQYSFAFIKNSTQFSRRTDKILSCVVSAFTSAYVFNWKKYFNELELKQIPTFDSRIVAYPNEKCLKDYFRWRQVDCHINNLYNTTFWCLVKTGKTNVEVEKILKDTNSAQKNQILFQNFEINYNNLDEVYRRGTFFLYKQVQSEVSKEKIEEKMSETTLEERKVEIAQIQDEVCEKPKKKQKQKQYKLKETKKIRRKLVTSHNDCLKEQFWEELNLK